MIGWGQIGYGAALSAVFAAVLLAAVIRGGRIAVVVTGGNRPRRGGADSVERHAPRRTRKTVLHRCADPRVPGQLARHRLRGCSPSLWRCSYTAWVHSLQNSHAAPSDVHCAQVWRHCSPTSTSTYQAATEDWSAVGGGMRECHCGAAARS